MTLMGRTHVKPHKGSLCCLHHSGGRDAVLHDRDVLWGRGCTPCPPPRTCLAWLSERCAWSSSSRRVSSSCRSCSSCTLWSSSCKRTRCWGLSRGQHAPAPLRTGTRPGSGEQIRPHFAGGVFSVLGGSPEKAHFPKAGILGVTPSLGPGEQKHPNPSVCIVAFSQRKKRQIRARGNDACIK